MLHATDSTIITSDGAKISWTLRMIRRCCTDENLNNDFLDEDTE